MASTTPRWQRIIIIIIAVVMLLGTLGAYLAYFLIPKNQAIDQKRCEELLAGYQKKAQARQDKINQQSDQLSGQYYGEFIQYQPRVGKFEADKVETLEKVDLKIGDGAEIKSDSSYSAYYIGWRPDGYIFDQSISDGKLKSPLSSETGFIAGWQEGVIGMKLGGIREIAIPSDKAYGEAGSGDSIPANTPLKFIIMAIAQPSQPAEVEISDELLSCYSQ